MKNSSGKKKILFIEQNQDGTVGGSHHSLFHLIKALDRRKYEPVVMFYENNDFVKNFEYYCKPVFFRKPLGKKFNSPNAVLKFPYLFTRKVYNFITVSLIPFFRCIAFIIINNIDLIHLNNAAHAGWEWLFAAKLLRRKCVTHHRGFVDFGYLAKKRAKYFDRIVCISKVTEMNLIENGIKNNIVTIYNAIDVEDFQSRVTKDAELMRKELGIKEGSPIIGVVGNFQEWKGQMTVVRAVDILRTKYPNLMCLLIGDVSNSKKDREYFEKVKKEINKKDLGKNIIITGYREDVPNLINSLDIMVHSSVEPEPFGRVIIEGMCLGKPVIATNIGGPPEIIENGVTGFLVAPYDKVTLSAKIAYLLRDQINRRRIGQRAIRRVTDIFSIDKFSSEINSIYKEII